MSTVQNNGEPGHFMWTARAGAAFLIASLVACGGGGAPGSGDASSSSSAGNNGEPAAEHFPYWASDAGVRGNLTHLLGNGNAGGAVITLSAAEHAQVLRAAAQKATSLAAARPGRGRALAVAVQRRTVTGLSSTVFHTTNGSQQLPQDLTSATIEAIVPDGAGGFERIAATSRRSDGTYAIAGVPEGPHWVRFGLNHVWTDAAFIDWSFDGFGRADVVYGNQPTKLDIDAGNLSPWQANDALAWVVPMHGASLAITLASPTVLNAPAVGDTALVGFGLDVVQDLFGGLLDAAKGDQAFINQLVSTPGTDVRALARAMVLPPLSLADGSSTHINFGFLDIALTASLRLRWDRSAYASHAAAVNPSATPSTSFMSVGAFASAPLYGLPSDAYTLAEFNTFGSTDIDFGRIRYGNPFPADWNRVLDGFVGFTARYVAPGATLAASLERGLSSAELIDPATRDNASVRLQPRITPALQPQINGKSLFVNQLAVGSSPTLSWLPPQTGSANQYFVRLLELTESGSRSRLGTVARFYTTERTLFVPPGLMQPGHLYVFTIAAMNSTSPVTQPFRMSLPFSFATLMSAIVSP